MYVITEWFERYEVNDKGQPARAGDKLRVKPLDYVRSKVHGRAKGAGFQAMQRLAKERTWEVFGQFQKFLEIAGCENHDKRGRLLNARRRPASDEDLAFILGVPVETVQHTMQVLTNKQVEWILVVPDDSFQEFQENQESTKQDQIPGIPGAFINRTEPNRTETEQNSTEPNGSGNRTNSPEQNPAEQTDQNTASALNARSVSASARLDFGNRLRLLTGAIKTGDCTALWNLQNWADKQMDGETHTRILEIARDLQGSRNRMAVFFARLESDLGYRPAAEADKKK